MAESAKDVAERLAGPHGRCIHESNGVCPGEIYGIDRCYCGRRERVAAIEAAIREAREDGRAEGGSAVLGNIMSAGEVQRALAEARRQGREDAEPKQAEVDAIYQRMRQAEFKAEDLLERVRTLEEMLSRQHLEHPGRPKSACAVCSLLAASKTLPKAASQEMRAEAVRRIRAIRALPLEGPGEEGE